MDDRSIGKRAAVLTIGNEIISGKVVDTNSAYISSFLAGHGYRVVEKISVGDHPGDIADAFGRASARYDLVVATGGLGPTHDDITTQTVCGLLGLKRVYSGEVHKSLAAFYRKRGREVPRVSIGYTQIPEGAVILSNRAGIAPGLFLNNKILLLPGVPSEMRAILEDHGAKVIPHGGVHTAETVFHTAGIGEAQLLGLVEGLDKILEIAELSSLPENGRVDLRLTVRGSTKAEAAQRLKKAGKMLGKGVKGYLFGRDEDTIASVVGRELKKKGKTLSVAESCTGGAIGEAVTSIPGSSEYFIGGIVAYHNRVKEKELGVPKSVLTKHGAVSEETALSMARGIRRKFKSDFGLSVTGIAGPHGGTKEKPVGLVYLGVSGPGGESALKLLLGGSRDTIRQRSAFEALLLLLGVLTGKGSDGVKADGGWRVYLAECRDKSLYCGITNNVEKRLKSHNSGKGALYTRWKGPVTLAARSPAMSKREAMSLERRVKKLKGRAVKLAAVKKG